MRLEVRIADHNIGTSLFDGHRRPRIYGPEDERDDEQYRVDEKADCEAEPEERLPAMAAEAVVSDGGSYVCARVGAQFEAGLSEFVEQSLEERRSFEQGFRK
jgi:hypothetical protein